MKVRETVREDGLRIISGRVPSKKVRMELRAGVGSAYDPLGKEGLFHYFEHMAFKGTTGRSVEDINSFMGRNLLFRNASTGKLGTNYYAGAVFRKFPPICEFLCDLYFHSVFPETEMEREKEVILNEIARNNDQDRYRANFALREQLWERNPLRMPGVGSPEGVKNVSRNDLLSAQKHWYIPSNTVCLAVGRVDHNDLVAELNRHIPHNSTQVEHKTWSDEYGVLPRKQEVIVELPKRQKAIFLLGSKFPFYKDEKTNVLTKFLEYFLVRHTTSRLWREIREKRGLSYALSGGVARNYRLGHFFYVYVETLPQRVKEVQELVSELLMKPLDDADAFEETREWLYDWFTLDPEELSEWLEFIVGALERGMSPKSAERYLSRMGKLISSISLEEVEDLRKSSLRSEQFVTVIAKPV